MQPVTPEPDAKDWTWSITERCAECGYDPATVTRGDVARLVREYTGAVLAALGRPDATTRPQPAVWSPLEYGCHVRDVCGLFRQRLDLMLTEDDPVFANWDQDDTALADRYWAQQPGTVAAQLQDRADELAAAFAAVPSEAWNRPGRRSNGSAFTVDTFARYLLHDLAHHAADVSTS